MKLSERLAQLFSKNATHLARIAIARDHVKDADYSDEPLESGKHYFRLWLTEMFLTKEVDWFRRWYPMAHSLVVLQFGDQQIEIPHIAGPSHLKDVDEAHLERFVTLDHPMTGLMPFNGGLVEVAVALLAMKGQDYIASVGKVLGDLSKLLIAPQLSGVLNIALPVASGIEDLLGGQSGEIHLGLNQSFTGKDGGGANVLRGGYFAVVRGREADYPAAQLWVVENRLRRGPTLSESTPLEGVTYMLFRIESQTNRDDFRSLKSIADPFKEALRYLAEGDEDKATDALRRTLLLVRTSPDLTRAHRSAVASALREEFDEAKREGLGAVSPGAVSLDEIVRRRAGSVDDALARAPSLQRLFG
jgi:hypothetical protein